MSSLPLLKPWPIPAARPKRPAPNMKPMPGYVGFAHATSMTAVRLMTKSMGLGLVPMVVLTVGAVGVVMLVSPKEKVDEDDKALKDKAFEAADQAWLATRVPIQHEIASSVADLEAIREKGRNGLFPPLSDIRIDGWLAKEIKTGFNDIEELIVKEKVHHLELAGEFVEAASMAIAMSAVSYPLAGLTATAKIAGLTKKVFRFHGKEGVEKEMAHEGEKIAKASLAWHKHKIVHAAAIDKFFRNESAGIVWEFARNGIKLIETHNGAVLLRWGERTDGDYRRMFGLPPAPGQGPRNVWGNGDTNGISPQPT